MRSGGGDGGRREREVERKRGITTCRKDASGDEGIEGSLPRPARHGGGEEARGLDGAVEAGGRGRRYIKTAAGGPGGRRAGGRRYGFVFAM